jgi:hypothetical protein
MKIKEIVTEAGVLGTIARGIPSLAQGFAKGLAPNVYSASQKARDTAKTMETPWAVDKNGQLTIDNDPQRAAQYNQAQKVQKQKQQLFHNLQLRAAMKNGISVDEIDQIITSSGLYPDATQRQAAVNRAVSLLQQQNVNVTDRTLGGTSGGMTKQQFMRPSPSAAAAQTAPAAPAATAGASMAAKMSAASTPQSTAQALRQRRAQGLPESKAQKKIIRHK